MKPPASRRGLLGSRISLRWQLIAWVTGTLAVSFAVLFFVVYQETGSQLRGRVDQDAASATSSLGQALGPLRHRPAELRAEAQRYMRSQPFRAEAPVLFVLGPGAAPLSNHPELFGGGPDVGETAGEQGQENQLGRAVLTPRLGYTTLSLPDVGRLRIFEQSIGSPGRALIVGAGVPLSVVESAQHAVAHVFLVSGLAVLALAVLASAIAGAFVSRPLRRMAQVAHRVSAGDLAPRIGGLTGTSSEAAVLGEAFDNMLDRLEEAFSYQREFVADASHELRTPLTVMRGQLELLAGQAEPAREDVRRVEQLVRSEIDRMSRLVDDLLLLAQSGRFDFLHKQRFELVEFLTDLWEGFTATADRHFELGPIPAGVLEADPDRVAQALRNLLTNAVAHTRPGTGMVRLDVIVGGGSRVQFQVSDDGPGIPEAERERIFERFHRLDRARTRAAGGSGLGLPIVRAIAHAHGGDALARAREDGLGARLELTVLGFSAAARQGRRRGQGTATLHRA